jgi:hypothetical protein
MPTYQVGHDETLPAGVYGFRVVDATEKESKTGNPTIELQLLIESPDRKNGVRFFDYLTFVPNSFWKIDAFRIATGEQLVQGQTVDFESEDCIGRTGRVSLTVEKYEGRSRNKVEEYVDPNAENPLPATSSAATPNAPELSLEQEFRAKGVPDDEDDIPKE